jgi:hypothetical protein
MFHWRFGYCSSMHRFFTPIHAHPLEGGKDGDAVHPRSTPGKLESIEVSISLSLATLDLTSNPDAVQLLSILCQLPDGLRQWEERLPLILIGAGLQNFVIWFMFSIRPLSFTYW